MGGEESEKEGMDLALEREEGGAKKEKAIDIVAVGNK